MAKEIPTAKRTTVTLSTGVPVVVQELPTRGVIASLGDIQKIIAKSKALGSIDKLLASFREAEGQNVDRLLDALNMILSILGDDPDLLPRMIVRCLVDRKGTPEWTADAVGELMLDDVLALGKAVYQVNWVEGSLKKALGRLGIKFEEPKASPDLRTLPKLPSETPADKTS